MIYNSVDQEIPFLRIQFFNLQRSEGRKFLHIHFKFVTPSGTYEGDTPLQVVLQQTIFDIQTFSNILLIKWRDNKKCCDKFSSSFIVLLDILCITDFQSFGKFQKRKSLQIL